MERPADTPCILVVDDDPSITRLLEVALRSYDVQVVTTNRAFGVLQLIAQQRVDLVILDVMMPGLDGLSIVELIRADPEIERTRIVLHSAMDPAELRARGREVGADRVLPKASRPSEAVETLAAWMDAWGRPMKRR